MLIDLKMELRIMAGIIIHVRTIDAKTNLVVREDAMARMWGDPVRMGAMMLQEALDLVEGETTIIAADKYCKGVRCRWKSRIERISEPPST
jgi:hypothetical protein